MNENATFDIISLDFETFYSKEFSLTKMSTQSYILSPHFETIGVGIQLNDEEAQWFSGTHNQIKEFLTTFPWTNSVVVAHNALFDGAILEWLYEITPMRYFCSMMASRPICVPYTPNGRMSLAVMSEYLGLGLKGTEVLNAIGKRRINFSPEELAQYGEYCTNDVKLCRGIYDELSPQLPETEQKLIDATIKKFTRPQIKLNRNVLTTRLATVRREKENMLARTALMDRSELMSNDKFANLLRNNGVIPPTKISTTTGKETYAFAKTDLDFKALLDHPNPKVAALVAARLKVKSTQEETRLERFIDISYTLDKTNAKFAMPLLYYGAHTGRFSGLDKLNLQNLPRGSELRRALEAPEGYKIVAGDLSQIEARITATLAGQDDLIHQFAAKEDPYSLFASDVYGYAVSKATPTERFVGKTCILSLQYGVGKDKLYDHLTVADVDTTKRECEKMVRLYRNRFYRIKMLWYKLEDCLAAMAADRRYEIFPGIYTMHEALVLPNGLRLVYPNLRQGKNGWVYDSKGKETNLYGAKLVENLVQALARIVVSTAELRLYDRGWLSALQVHDELIYVVKEELVDKFTQVLDKVLTMPVEWMPDLPVDCEIESGDNYYEAK